MLTWEVTTEYIQHGFIEADLINTAYRQYLDFDKIIPTCQRDTTKGDYELCFSKFDKLFQNIVDNVILPDTFFKKLNFLLD